MDFYSFRGASDIIEHVKAQLKTHFGRLATIQADLAADGPCEKHNLNLRTPSLPWVLV